MKAIPSTLCSILTAMVCWLASGMASDSYPPERMTFQGFLVDANGNPLGNTNTGPKNYDVIFRVWTEQNAGTLLWGEQQTLTVDKGNFSVVLGEGNAPAGDPYPALSTLFTNVLASDRFVEMTVKGIGLAGGDATILPRLRLVSAPYAFVARNAFNAVNATSLANTNNTQIVSITSTNVGINKLNPATALDVNGTVTAAAVSASTASLGTLTVNVLNAASMPGQLNVNSINATNTVTAATFVGNGTIPLGGIIMWSGAVNAVPAGWALCNGQNGTPDLRDRFVVGAGLSYDKGAVGGANTHTLRVDQMPAHSHTYKDGYFSDWNPAGIGNDYVASTIQGGGSTDFNAHYIWFRGMTTDAAGSGNPVDHRPPYYALAFIMRVQ